MMWQRSFFALPSRGRHFGLCKQPLVLVKDATFRGDGPGRAHVVRLIDHLIVIKLVLKVRLVKRGNDLIVRLVPHEIRVVDVLVILEAQLV